MKHGVYTAVEKLRCIERELALRRRVYPRSVAIGKMTQARADQEIRVMEDIAADYAVRVTEDERQLL